MSNRACMHMYIHIFIHIGILLLLLLLSRFSHVRLLATPWTAAFQAPLSMGFSRKEYWSAVPLPSPESCSVVPLFAAPWSVAHQVSLSMEFSRQEYWRIQPFSSPSDLPNPGIKLRSPTLQVESLPVEPPGKPMFFDVSY